MENELKTLEETYCKASNALSQYRLRNGFVPGVRVRAQYHIGHENFGVIAPYGPKWDSVSRNEVPVMLDQGGCQRWSMSDLTVISKLNG